MWVLWAFGPQGPRATPHGAFGPQGPTNLKGIPLSAPSVNCPRLIDTSFEADYGLGIRFYFVFTCRDNTTLKILLEKILEITCYIHVAGHQILKQRVVHSVTCNLHELVIFRYIV